MNFCFVSLVTYIRACSRVQEIRTAQQQRMCYQSVSLINLVAQYAGAKLDRRYLGHVCFPPPLSPAHFFFFVNGYS